MTVFLDTRSASSRASPAPSYELRAAARRKVCAFQQLVLSHACNPPVPIPVSVPSWDPRKPPQRNPSCSTQESRPVSDEEYSYLGPQLCYRTPSLVCPLPLASAPAALRCVVLCCTASFSATVHRARLSQSACPPGGSRRSILPSCWLSSSGRVPRGPSWVCLSALLPRPRVEAQTPALEPSGTRRPGL